MASLFVPLALALVVCAAVALLVALRLGALADRWLDQRQQVIDAELARPASPTREPMPHDLYSLAMGPADEWAREQTLAAMQEAYDETGSWDLVRLRFGIKGDLS